MSERGIDEVGIDGVSVRDLRRFDDSRGWLTEVYRTDELDHQVAMSYVSYTHAGQVRGPHEHTYQTDHFVFLGPGDFELFLWDARLQSRTTGAMAKLIVGLRRPCSVTVPPGVVHAYRCCSEEGGLVFNLPDKLYGGPGKRLPVDEIRHEGKEGSLYLIE